MTRRSFALAAGASLAAVAPSASPQFRKSVCNPMIPGSKELPARFRTAKNAGFDGVELRLGPRPSEVSPNLSADELSRLREAAEKADVTIVSVWATTSVSGGSLFSPEEAEQRRFADHIRKTVDAAAALDSGAVLMNLGPIGRGPRLLYRYGDAWRRSQEIFEAELIPYAVEKQVTLTPENVWNKFLMSPLEFRQYVRQFNSRSLQAHFDTGNVMPWGYAQDWILTLGPLTQRVHLKDFKLGDRPNEGNFIPLLEGDVDFAAVMAAFQEVGYHGWLSPEGPEVADEAALRDLSNRVDRIIAMA